MEALYKAHQLEAPPDDPLHHLDPAHQSMAQFCHSEAQAAHNLHMLYAGGDSDDAEPHLCYPRLLLCGKHECGQQRLSLALLYAMRETRVFFMPTIAKTGDPCGPSLDAALTRVFNDACWWVGFGF